MKKYDFSFDKIPVSVITDVLDMTVRQAVADTLCDGGYAVLVYPDADVDFGALCIDKNNLELREPHLALAALSCFFKEIRHLPDIKFEVTYRGKVYELDINDDRKKFTVNVGKCKIICAKTVKFDDLSEIDVYVGDNGYEYACTVCHDCEHFLTDRLSLIPSLIGMRRDTPAVAVSFGDTVNIKSVGAIPFYDALAIGLSTLSRSGTDIPRGAFCARINSFEHSACYSSGKLTFYPDIKYLY